MSKIKARFIRFGVGADDVNARLIPANFTPTSYIPSQVAAEGNDKISAHLKGIDTFLSAIGSDNILHVKASPGFGEFATVAAALASITTASITNQFKILVDPGVFLTAPFTMKQWVHIEGEGEKTTVLQNTNSALPLVQAVPNSSIRNIGLTGLTDPGVACVQLNNSSIAQVFTFTLDNVSFGTSSLFVELLGTAIDNSIVLRNCIVNANAEFESGFRVERVTGTSVTQLTILNLYGIKGTGGTVVNLFEALGTVTLTILNTVYQCNNTGTGVVASDGAILNLGDVTLSKFDIGVHVANNGAASRIIASPVNSFGNVTWDLFIDHPTAIGAYQGSAASNKTSIASNMITLSVFDVTNGGVTFTGPFRSGRSPSSVVDIRDLLETATTKGVTNGGTLSVGAGFTVNVAAGFGYIRFTGFPNNTLKRYDWANTSITLAANQDVYIYFNTSGILSTSASFPDTSANILLGRAVTNASSVLFIDKTPMVSTHTSNSFDETLRVALGPIYNSGSIVSENVTPLHLDVTGGVYYLSALKFSPVGGTNINFTPLYRDGLGGWTLASPVNVVDENNYDDGSGTLAPLTAGFYAKHALYLASAGTDQYYLLYGQAEFSALASAIAGSDPSPPSFFRDEVVHIASIIVWQGTGMVAQIIDTRPTLSFRSGSTAGTSDHGNLSGLGDDDHPQYLLVDGTRAMAGGLDMGGNSITNVNLVDGVDVSAHGSRHLPNGADPLTTAIAFQVRPDNVAAIGTANAFARSDHLHALPSAAPAASIAPDQANAAGTANSVSRSDHTHNVPTAAAIGVLPNNANGVGVSTSFARADHSHALPNAAAITIVPDQANAAGTANSVARSDHVHQVVTAAAITLTPDAGNTQGASTSFSRADHGHNIATAAAINVAPNNANGVGVSSSFARADHSHALPSAAATTQTPDQANAAGTANTVARSDHVHLIATAIAVNIGTANAQGASTSFARADHVHQGIHSLKANTGGTARFGDIVLQQGTGLTITDDGAGTFTFETIDGANEFSPSIGTLLNVAVTGGNITYNGTRFIIGNGNVGVNPNVTNGSIYIDTDGAVKATAGAGNPPDDTYPIALFTSNATNVTAVTDIRTYLNQNVIWGQTANITTILPNDAADAGTSNRHARADHKHAIAVASAVSLTPDAGNSAGASTSFSRADHVHDVPTATAIGLNANSASTTGAAATFSRSNHSHAIASGAASTQTPDQANATGTSTNFARADHTHNIPTATAVGLDSTSTSTQGAAAAFARADHTHAISSGIASTQTPDQANAAGTSPNFAKADHVHNIPTASAVGLTANSTSTQGAAATFARADHTHAIASGIASTQTPDQANAAGSSTNFARADHVHTIPTAAAIGLTATTGNTQGAAATFARSDHTHSILTGAPATQTPDQTNDAGTGTALARADHIHAIATAAAITLTPNAGNSQGVSTSFSRADHGHNVPTAAPTTSLSATTANADGAAGSFARSDHTHALLTGAASTQTPDQSNTTGSSANLARADHGHNIPTATAVGLDAASTSTQGAAATFARSNHTHAIASGVAVTQNADQANAAGTSANFARADHIHNIPTAIVVDVGSANAQGSSSSFSKSDHVHKGLHSLAVNGGTQRFGDINLKSGVGVTVVDDGAGNFTFDTLDAASEFVVTAGVGLLANYTAGKVWFNGTFTSVAAGSVLLTASQTNWFVYVDVDATVKNAATVPPNAMPLARFTTGPATITSITEAREQVNHSLVWGLAGDIANLTATASAAPGTSNKYADAGHVHTISTGAASTQTPDQANATGSSANLARADHVHQIVTAAAVQLVPDAANAQGASTSFSRADHVHNVPTASAVGLDATSTSTQGAAATFARSNHTHAIASGAPSTQTPDQVNATGTSANFARADHIHTIATAAAVQLTPDQANAVGVSTSFARADHVHNVPTASAVGLDTTSTSTQGAAATFARSNHTHAIASGAPSTQTPDQANAAGSSSNFAKADHIHLIATAAAVQLVPDAANAQGVSTSFARADHVHNVPTATAVGLDASSTSTQGAAATFARSNHTHAIASGVVSTQNADQANAAGTSANFARADHIHNIPTAAPVSIGTANAQGSAGTFAKSDHVHQGIHQLKATSGGTARFGDIVLQQGNSITVTDDGAGNFTFETIQDIRTTAAPSFAGLTLTGGLKLGSANTTSVAASPYTVLTTDLILLVDTSAARTINLPDPALRRIIHIVDKTGTAEAFNITLARFASEQILGLAANKVLQTNWGSWTIFSDGTNWFFL